MILLYHHTTYINIIINNGKILRRWTLKSIVKARTVAIIMILMFGIIFPTYAAEQEKINPVLEKGIGQYKHENYEEALTLLKKAREEDPKSTLAAYYLGLTHKQLQNYKEAIPPLRDAVTFSPKIKGALIELVDCLYQLGKLDEAKKWIAEAENEGIRPAQTAFLKGLVLLKEGNGSDAIDSFETAKELDKSMAQACDYQIGLAYLTVKNFGDAKRVFKQLVLVDPNSTTAYFANEYMNAITKREEAMKPFKMTFGAAWQYDDNVVLMPSDTSLATNIADKTDSREVYTASAEYDKRFGDQFGVKGQYFFYYGKQNDLGFYDVLSNTFAIQPSLYFKDSLLTFPTAYNHTLVNDKAFLSTPSTSAVYNFMVGKSNMGQLYTKYQYRDYLWSPSTPQEDRTGNDLGGGVGWYLFYAKNKGFVNLRYGLNREWTNGANWHYVGDRVSAALLVPLMDKLNLTVTGDLFMQDFTRSHTTFHIYRKDRVYTLSSLLAYKIYKDSEIQLQYTHVNDDSNISIYDYTRNIYSVGAEIKF